MDGGCGGESLGHVERAWFLCVANDVELPACGPARVIELASLIVDVLERGQNAVLIVKRNHQPAIACDPCAVGSDVFTGQVWMLW